MTPFRYQRAVDVAGAVSAGTRAGTVFLAGGTTLVDLMKLEILNPAQLVDLTRLPLTAIELSEKGARLGALSTNAAVAARPGLKQRFPAVSEALLAGASPQLRNVATTGGNLLQRTRCAYFRDHAARCNKREQGSGCSALEGYTRMHAVLGVSDACIATHPSDFCVALAALDATVEVRGPQGTRKLAFEALHLLPGETPQREFALEPGELVTAVELPASAVAARSRYVKVRDREEYAFALASCAAAIEVNDGKIVQARLALGGVATRPWRARAAEQSLVGQGADVASFRRAAALAMEGAKPRPDNAYKVQLAQRVIERALTLSSEAA